MRVVRVGPGDDDLVRRAGHLFDEPPRPEWVARFLVTPGHHLLLALSDDGEPAGFVSGVEMVHPDKGVEMLVYELGTDEAHRRRGVASALLAELAAIADDHGCHSVWVVTEPDNAAALATYRSAGYSAEPTMTLVRSRPAAP